MDGILIIDKPQGMTSHDVVRRVRRALKVRQVGHAGSLDPMATGVLQLGVGEGTRILQFLMAGEKAYRTTMKLGETTDTQDAEGKILGSCSLEGITPEKIASACRSLTGVVEQVPPMYSALKKEGVPLYRLARQGIEIEREPRKIHVGHLAIEEIRLPFVTLKVECSKGTYVRTLCHDVGQLLGCGAHMTFLRRIRSGSFSEGESLPLSALENGGIEGAGWFSLREALRDYSFLEVREEAGRRLRHGIPPELKDVSGSFTRNEGETIVLEENGILLALARFAPSRFREKRGDFELLRVFARPEAA